MNLKKAVRKIKIRDKNGRVLVYALLECGHKIRIAEEDSVMFDYYDCRKCSHKKSPKSNHGAVPSSQSPEWFR